MQVFAQEVIYTYFVCYSLFPSVVGSRLINLAGGFCCVPSHPAYVSQGSYRIGATTGDPSSQLYQFSKVVKL